MEVKENKRACGSLTHLKPNLDILSRKKDESDHKHN